MGECVVSLILLLVGNYIETQIINKLIIIQLNLKAMRYYYFNPFSKQYYFPEGFQKYPLFATFYQPYKMCAKIMLNVWQSSTLFLYIFSTKRPEKILPLEQIGQFVPPNSILAFNLGSAGVEKKISILGIDPSTNETFFIKYANKKVACNNVYNEGLILQQITHLSFVPKLHLKVNLENQYTLIKTSVLDGERINFLHLNEQILTILFTLSNQQVKSNRIYNSSLKSCFAHGDFCPWNMLTYQGNINVFDWELAGVYPLGYDLFTYIFQYECLVKENVRFDIIVKENSEIIQKYFKHFNIDYWIPYLREFSNLKHKLESDKNDKVLIDYYFRLKELVSKI